MPRPPVGQVAGKKEQVEAMFDAIAPRYDLLNRLISFGIDIRWRRRAIELAGRALGRRPARILDVATGTGDLAIEALRLKPEEVVGVDISEEMLSVGREKLAARGLSEKISMVRGDSERLPFDDGAYDLALVAFGVRNFENLRKGLSDIRRVLAPGGVLVVLELSKPRRFPFKQGYAIHTRYILPLVGRLVSGDSGAYTYLPESVRAFPDGEDFLAEMRAAGFSDLAHEPQTFGVATVYVGRA
jgi:demethylmenaquinone methyltransferase / 2-methoxy-6-polyprenyl-1,4-benzoquinol methylase